MAAMLLLLRLFKGAEEIVDYRSIKTRGPSEACTASKGEKVKDGIARREEARGSFVTIAGRRVIIREARS